MTSDPIDQDETEFSPEAIGRYEIRDELGRGGFGRVYLAFDSQLAREVAIKVPHERIRGILPTEQYLEEARMVAKLDHPNIVPVYDVGTTPEFDCFIVSKYIRGTDLKQVARRGNIDASTAVYLCAAIADALHHAHKRGLIHRDVKPSNILIDQDNQPYLTDFGLAISDERRVRGTGLAGTPAYMSPEQARREGHRIDGRSDLFSLGAVLYELLSGRRAFQGSTRSELREQVEFFQPRPLRQYNELIPRELDRICQKAMAKRSNERYWSAHDFAEDLRSFFKDTGSTKESISQIGLLVDRESQPIEQTNGEHETDRKSSSEKPTADLPSGNPAILPKGLRSFDTHDSDFFLELLAGPRDRTGIPDSIRFWKNQIESPTKDGSFSVGLLYGPSGCGKSSFVKAGLLPNLERDILPILVDATPAKTETTLMAALRQHFPDLDSNAALGESIELIRCGDVRTDGRKIVLILDQFERWLHAADEQSGRELIKALRQCDGQRVSAILMVRSDFWMAIVRFLDELEVDLVQGKNFATIDLFPPKHAKGVLTSFGRAYGVLPKEGALPEPQQAFIDEAVSGLEQDGKVICVRLALFAEMMKHKPWEVATLRQIGGATGVGLSFLNDSFGPQANPKNRVHYHAAQKALKALLPDPSLEVNVRSRSYDDLRMACGYKSPARFDELMRVLDDELKLVSPADTSRDEEDVAETSQLKNRKRHYQLSHDYLVGALRDWLTRQQRETRQGRAELLLEERSSFWNSKKENRYLPSLLEHYQIRTLTPSKTWSSPQQDLMRQAARTHGSWLLMAIASAAALLIVGFGVRNSVVANQNAVREEQRVVQRQAEAERLVDGLVKADTNRLSDFLSNLEGYRVWANPLIIKTFENSPDGSLEKVNCAVALCESNPEARRFLWQRLPDIGVSQLPAILHQLKQSGASLPGNYAALAQDTNLQPNKRLRLSAAIAQLAPDSDFWSQPECRLFVANELTTLYPSELAPFRDAFAPVSDQLVDDLIKIYGDPATPPQQRTFATDTLVQYLLQDPERAANLMLDGNAQQFARLYATLDDNQELLATVAKRELAKLIEHNLEDQLERSASVKKARRKANAAVALYRLNQSEAVWASIESERNPDYRSMLIHYLAERNDNPDSLIDQIKKGSAEPSAQVHLLLSIGEFSEESLTQGQRENATKACREIASKTNFAHVRSAANWALTQLGNGQFVEDLEAGEFLVAKEQLLQWKSENHEVDNRARQIGERKQNWFYAANGQMMIRLTAGDFLMGEKQVRENEEHDQNQHTRKIDRVFGLARTEVTVGQWQEFLKSNHASENARGKFAKSGLVDSNLPIGNVSWIEAANYCNWLSEQEGIPKSEWCYQRIGNNSALRVKQNFLRLTGYRLPTEPEWEFACRAGTQSRRFMGESTELLENYAWYQVNAPTYQSIAQLKPNDFGFFDILGNVMEWCFERHVPFKQYDEIATDAPSVDARVGTQPRSLRGGAYYDMRKFIRSGHRYSYNPESQLLGTGFRVARTISPVGSNATADE